MYSGNNTYMWRHLIKKNDVKCSACHVNNQQKKEYAYPLNKSE